MLSSSSAHPRLAGVLSLNLFILSLYLRRSSPFRLHENFCSGVDHCESLPSRLCGGVDHRGTLCCPSRPLPMLKIRFNILACCDDDFIHRQTVRHLYPCPLTRLMHSPGHAEYLLTPQTSVHISLSLAPPARIVVCPRLPPSPFPTSLPLPPPPHHHLFRTTSSPSLP